MVNPFISNFPPVSSSFHTKFVFKISAPKLIFLVYHENKRIILNRESIYQGYTSFAFLTSSRNAEISTQKIIILWLLFKRVIKDRS